MADPITPLTPDQIAAARVRAAHEGYLHRLIVQVDILLNVAGDGKPDMTISSRAALAAQHGSEVGKVLSSFLNLFQPDHGLRAEIGDQVRAEGVQQAVDPNILANTEYLHPASEAVQSDTSVLNPPDEKETLGNA